MSEEDLELLITMDDPGEETLEEDTFHHHPTESSTQSDGGEELAKPKGVVARRGLKEA